MIKITPKCIRKIIPTSIDLNFESNGNRGCVKYSSKSLELFFSIISKKGKKLAANILKSIFFVNVFIFYFLLKLKYINKNFEIEEEKKYSPSLRGVFPNKTQNYFFIFSVFLRKRIAESRSSFLATFPK